MTKKSIFIINASDWYNKGDVLNRVGAISAIKKANNNVNIAIESATYEQDDKYFRKFGAHAVESIFSYKAGDSLRRLIPLFVWYAIVMFYLVIFNTFFRVKPSRKNKVSNYFNALVNSDLVLSSPGGFIHDELPLTVFVPSIFQIALPILLRKRVLIFAQTIGPLNHKVSRLIVKLMLKKMSYVTLREDISYDLVKSLDATSNVVVTADCAFSVSSDVISLARERSSMLKKQRSKPLVGVTVLNRYWGSPENGERYIKTMAGLVDWLVEELETDVLFIPWRVSSSDNLIARKVHSLVKHKDSVILDFEDYSPERLLSIIGSLDLLVGTRMHSCISAALMDVPFLNIVYQFKSKGIMHMLEMDKYTIPIDELTEERLTKLLSYLWWHDRLNVRMLLRSRVRNLKGRSELNGQIVDYFLEKK